MFEDIVKEEKKKEKEVYETCIGCDKLLKKGERCPTCNPDECEAENGE